MEKEFTETIAEHNKIIYKVCRLYCSDKDDRQDLFQDIMLQLWRAFPSFRKESRISTWIYRIALNTAITRLRKEKKLPVKQSLDQEVLEQAASTTNEEEEQFQMMLATIEKLSPVEKAIIMLYLEDYSYREMAEVIGISESNVGFKINQIKGKLKSLITG